MYVRCRPYFRGIFILSVCTVQQHEMRATAVQLSQECSDEALLQLSTEIAGYNIYKHRLGLSDAEIEDIDQNPQTFFSVPGKFYAALKRWKRRSIDFDNPSNSAATYGRLVEIAAKIMDGEAVRSIHKACVKHTSELPNTTWHNTCHLSLLHHTIQMQEELFTLTLPPSSLQALLSQSLSATKAAIRLRIKTK